MTSEYRPRLVDARLDELVDVLPAIFVKGAKGVGKTAMARRRARTTVSLEEPVTRSRINADPGLAVIGEPPILIDEWQREPDVWDLVRAAVDNGAAPGSFLLTGSDADPAVRIHSGAGRIVELTLRPMTLSERAVAKPAIGLDQLLSGGAAINGASSLTTADYADEICWSGFPGIRSRPHPARAPLLEGYTELIANKDVAEAGFGVRRPELLLRWLRAYAAATATTATFESIRAAATSTEGDKPSEKTATPYRETLTRLGILEPISAWDPGAGHLSRLAKSVKHHLVDPALAATLLGIDPQQLLDSVASPLSPRPTPLLGPLFESLACLQLKVLAELAGARVQHLRTRNGDHEVDFIVERRDSSVLAIETKAGPVVRDADAKHLNWLHDRIGPRLIDRVIINTGPEAYRRRDGVAVIPLGLLG